MSAWVIGGTSGIGAACAQVLRSAGYAVHATGSEVDVTSDTILREYVEARGPFSHLVYSAGINYLEWSEKLDCERAAEVYNINVLGLIRALSALSEHGGLRRVVVVGSDAAWRPMRTSAAYNASKAGLHAAVQCIARERAHEDFAINVVAPGLTYPTYMTSQVIEMTKNIRGWTREAAMDYMVGGIPLGRPTEPVEVGYLVRDILESPPSLNGAIIPMNGGR